GFFGELHTVSHSGLFLPTPDSDDGNEMIDSTLRILAVNPRLLHVWTPPTEHGSDFTRSKITSPGQTMEERPRTKAKVANRRGTTMRASDKAHQRVQHSDCTASR